MTVNRLIRTLTVSTLVMGLSIGDALAAKWLGHGIICQNYEDTTSMAVESNMASSDLAAMKVYMKYISNGKCILHKKCEKVVYMGRGSKEFFDKLRKKGEDQLIKIAKMVPVSGIQLSKNGKTHYVQDGYLATSRSKCK